MQQIERLPQCFHAKLCGESSDPMVIALGDYSLFLAHFKMAAFPGRQPRRFRSD